MMIGTLITDENRDFFLQVVDSAILDDGDIFIGAIDDEERTACGVLVAKARKENTLDILFIYVEPSWRSKGAGTTLLNTLRDVAASIDADRIVCTSTRGNNEDDVESLLETNGFFKDIDQTYPIYRISLGDLEIKETTRNDKAGVFVSLNDIDEENWKTLWEEWQEESGEDMCREALMADKNLYDPDMSVLTFDKKGTLNGVFLVSEQDGEYFLEAFGATGSNAPSISYAILQHLQKKSDTGTFEDTFLNICPVRKNGKELLAHITGGAMIQVGEIAYYTLELTV